jgi:methylmalonyl-CoA mutase N-terminal domain/subunit
MMLGHVQKTRQLRTEQFQSGKTLLIGINAYANEFDAPKVNWAEAPIALGLPYLIFEKLAN